MSNASEKVYKALNAAIEIRDDSGNTAILSGGVGTIPDFITEYERELSEDAERILREMLKDKSLPDDIHYRLGYAKGAKESIEWLLLNGWNGPISW